MDRRRTLAAVGALTSVVLLMNAGTTLGAHWPWPERAAAPASADAAGVAIGPDGLRRLLPPGTAASALVPGSRALAGAPAQARAQQRWLAGGSLPGTATGYADLARDALLDLHVLTLDNGAATAAWSPGWRYVWPRDASFVAVALATTGHQRDALGVLGFLARVQSLDGTFQARYRPDGSGVPDDRGVELDGSGWVLWAAWEVVLLIPSGPDRTAALNALASLVDRAAAACRRAIDTRTGLPPPSLDYWESDREVTLGTAAPLLAGLRAAVQLHLLRARVQDAWLDAAAARRLDAAMRGTFGSAGYPRVVGGRAHDAAVTFLMPPFTGGAGQASAADNGPEPGVLTAWQAAQSELLRPAGGLSPGAQWRDQQISWTPETALFALTAAASGQDVIARHWLTWLDAHRTTLGALPEKVLADGSTASVAPLAWTAASVVLAVSELDHPHP